MADEIKKEETSIDPAKSADADNGVSVPEKFKTLIEQIEKMSVMDLAEIVKILEKKFGVSASLPTMMVNAPNGGATTAQAEEKSIFNVELTEAGGNKIAVIKAIRALIEMGLKDAKNLVDAAPKIVKEGVKKEEADAIKKKLEEAGAKITLK